MRLIDPTAARILILDDEPDSVLLLQGILRQAGYSNHVGLSDCRQARERIQVFRPDLILLDLIMPHENGLTLLEWLRQHYSEDNHLPVLILTGDSSQETRNKALSTGANDILTKPFDRREVVLRIEKILTTRVLTSELLERNRWLEETVRIRTLRLAEQTQAMDQTRDAILVCDMHGQVISCNRGAQQLCGLRENELAGRCLAELLGPEPGRTEGEVLPTLLKSGEWQGEQRHAVAGCERVLQCRAKLIRAESGKPEAQLWILTDITEQRLLEAQFERTQRIALLGRLAGGIAHDLNNLLTPFLMGVEILAEKTCDTEQQSILEMMRENAERGGELVRQILDFVRGSQEEPQPTDLGIIVEQVGRLAAHTFPKSIQVQWRVASPLPPVLANPTQILQVLMNLCVNARDAMPSGGRLMIQAEARSPSGVDLSVRDTGVGISPEVMKKIFDPFFTTKEVGKGTGLGLATVQSIVTRYGGYVGVESDPGQGTTFRVTFTALENPQSSQPENYILRDL